MDKSSDPPKAQTATDLRRQREAEALRANLRRRKEQQRAREVPEPKVGDEQEEGPASG